MIGGLAQSLHASSTASLMLASCIIQPGEVCRTIYVSDTQLQHLGRRPFTDNPLIKRLSPPADRNVIATQTADVFIDELLRQTCAKLQQEEQATAERAPTHLPSAEPHDESHKIKSSRINTIVLGDMADTPIKSEYLRFEQLMNGHPLDVRVVVRGNHSSANAFGVVNLQSRKYRKLRGTRGLRQYSLRAEVEEVAGKPKYLLSGHGTFNGMRRLIHDNEQSAPSLNDINVSIAAADYDGYALPGSADKIPFDEAHRAQNFTTFWKPVIRQDPAKNEQPSWECLVNCQEIDREEADRETPVTPFYIQATEQSRFHLKDGSEIPVYTISMDGLDNNNLLPAINAEMSELQIRAIETFMDQMLQQNPQARFKLACHYSSQEMLKSPWIRRWRGRRMRKALRRLLSREEVILYTYGHTHEREVVDLNKELKLKRKTPLMQVNVPSLIDYHPVKDEQAKVEAYPYRDARALMIERTYVEQNDDGDAELKIDLQFNGINWDDMKDEGLTDKVKEALKEYRENYGYARSVETMHLLRKQHFWGWIHSHWKRGGEAIWGSLSDLIKLPVNAFNKYLRGTYDGPLFAYWNDVSFFKYIIDNFTVVSTVKMFSEALYLRHFIKSLETLIEDDNDPEELAIAAQLKSMRIALTDEYADRRHDFEAALNSGERPSELRQYNDLFERTRTYELCKLLLQLKPGGQARAFAVIAGIQASREEFEYHKKKPTEIPNKIPTISIPIGRTQASQQAVGG